MSLCLDARSAVETLHTLLETQLPYSYVQFIVFIISINNLLVALRSGVRGAVELANRQYTSVVAELVFVTVVSLLYQGLLMLTYVIHDPFGEDLLDLPTLAYQTHVSETCKAMLDAGSRCPAVEHLFPEGFPESVHPDAVIRLARSPAQQQLRELDRCTTEIGSVVTTVASQVGGLQQLYMEVVSELQNLTVGLSEVDSTLAYFRQQRLSPEKAVSRRG